MSIDAKVLSKILANLLQQYIKKIVHHDEVGTIQELQRLFSISTNQSV